MSVSACGAAHSALSTGGTGEGWGGSRDWGDSSYHGTIWHLVLPLSTVHCSPYTPRLPANQKRAPGLGVLDKCVVYGAQQFSKAMLGISSRTSNQACTLLRLSQLWKACSGSTSLFTIMIRPRLSASPLDTVYWSYNGGAVVLIASTL